MVSEKRGVIIELAKQLHKQTIFKTETRSHTGFFVFTKTRIARSFFRNNAAQAI
jgi:hypothetical protein